MKVCLIYVGIGVAGLNANRLRGDREGAWIGHGAALVGASLQAAGHDVSLIDLRQLANLAAIRPKIRDTPADVYGLSVSPVDHLSAVLVASMIRLEHPGAKIVAGGIHPTLFPEAYAGYVDTVVVGEGEVSMPLLLKNGGQWPKRVQGIKPDLAHAPWAARELFDYRRELDCFFAPDQKTPSITMLAGRGCAFHCTYCQPAENAVFGRPYRLRPAADVIAELRSLHDRYGYRSVTFWDDTFTFSKPWIQQFCALYEETGIRASIAACSRADIICHDEQMIARLAEVGVDWLVIGLESGSQRILDLIRKGTTVEQNREAIRICRKYGIKVFGTFMLGLPTETNEEAEATVRFIEEMRPELASPFFFVPIPGTDLHRYCEEKDLILPEAKEQTIARTGVFGQSIKGVDYDHLRNLLAGRPGRY